MLSATSSQSKFNTTQLFIYPISQVLEYVRTDVLVGGEQVLAVVLTDIEKALTFSLKHIRAALNRGVYGRTRVTKDFLLPGGSSTSVTRNVNSCRQKCEVFILSKLDDHSCDLLKAGKLSLVSKMLSCTFTIIVQAMYQNLIKRV